MQRKRLDYLDNVRVVLTLLVILHHLAIAYGAEGLHPYKDPNGDRITSLVLSYIVAVNQAYFMSAFFFLSGFLTPRSLEKKGLAGFLHDRLVRLGIPILFYCCVLLQVNEYLLDVYWRREPFASEWQWNIGHLWFLQLLLVFNFAYALLSCLFQRQVAVCEDRFPSIPVLWVCILVLALLTFLVRGWFPIGHAIMSVQPAHVLHYVVAFSAGILAYRGRWLDHLTESIGRYWGRVSVIVIPLLSVISLGVGVLHDTSAVDKLLGGFNPFAFGMSAWDSVLMVSMICWMLATFHSRYDSAGPFRKWLSANAYAVYIIHQTVLVAIHVALHDSPISATARFFLAATIAIPVCFGLSDLIRRIPGIQRILG